MKFLQFFCLFVALFAFSRAANSFWGNRTALDVLLSNDLVHRNGTAGDYVYVNLKFPKTGQINNRNITAIYVYDKYPNGRGAFATLWSGGPGFKFAAINLKSQYGQGINSTVEIYGR